MQPIVKYKQTLLLSIVFSLHQRHQLNKSLLSESTSTYFCLWTRLRSQGITYSITLTINFRSTDESELPSEQEFNKIPALQEVQRLNDADAQRRQLLLQPTDKNSIDSSPEPDGTTQDPEPTDAFIPAAPDEFNDIGSRYDELGNVQYWYNMSHENNEFLFAMVEL